MLVAGLISGIVAVALFALSNYFRIQELREKVSSDLNALAADLDFLYCRVADVDVLLQDKSVLGSADTAALRDWVDESCRVLDKAQALLMSQDVDYYQP